MSAFPAYPPPLAPATPDLASQLEGMLEELRRTREAVVGQMDAQIARASGLLKAIHGVPAPQPALPPLHPPSVDVMQAPPKLTSVVLASLPQAGIDPHLEQATLSELNEALSLAFTEIASRGGMLGR